VIDVEYCNGERSTFRFDDYDVMTMTSLANRDCRGEGDAFPPMPSSRPPAYPSFTTAHTHFPPNFVFSRTEISGSFQLCSLCSLQTPFCNAHCHWATGIYRSIVTSKQF